MFITGSYTIDIRYLMAMLTKIAHSTVFRHLKYIEYDCAPQNSTLNDFLSALS